MSKPAGIRLPDMLSVPNSPTGTFASSGSSSMASDRSHFEYDPSVNGRDRLRASVSSASRAPVGKPEKGRWYTQIKNWLSVSEPSAQAFKTQKKMTYKKHGIEFNDPQAAAKMHLPIVKLPEGAITSTSGPSPEKAFRRAQEQHKRQSCSALSHASQSMSSSIYSVPSTKEPNPVAPWEN